MLLVTVLPSERYTFVDTDSVMYNPFPPVNSTLIFALIGSLYAFAPTSYPEGTWSVGVGLSENPDCCEDSVAVVAIVVPAGDEETPESVQPDAKIKARITITRNDTTILFIVVCYGCLVFYFFVHPKKGQFFISLTDICLIMKINWEVKLGIVLVLVTLVIYSLKFLIFQNPGDTVNYIFNSLGFLPINVLLVTLVINRLLTMRSQRERLRKMNMVIGTFFSETGNDLISLFTRADKDCNNLSSMLDVKGEWGKKSFSDAKQRCKNFNYSAELSLDDLASLKEYLMEKRDFLLRLLENPILLENESFTELLRAVFHLQEELGYREEFSELPKSDILHLKGDINRVYGRIVINWIEYMEYLDEHFPYLFSLQMRINPFDRNACPIVKS